jgi:post-segregation antitoxin (ccd killing protein)
MARLNVYVPDDLAASARREGLNVSALTQDAIAAALAARATDQWLSSLGTEERDISHEDVLAALDAARDELGD